MAVETTIKASIVAEVDKKSFGDGVKFARDTGKEIDQNLKKRFELNIAEAQIKLKQIKDDLKKATSEEQKLKLQIDANELQRGLTESKRQLNNLVNTGDPALSRLQAKFNSVNDGVKGIQGTLGKLGSTIGEIGSSLGLAFGVGAIIQATQSVFGLVSAYQKYESVLTNSLGSAEEAKASLELIRDVAKSTPFEVNQLTESYIKLVNRGFKPTRDEIISLGDLASSQGKDFNQLVEALLDAQTGEFERLKEFGVRAKVSGDQVAFTFKGVTTTVQKTDEAIKGYILGLGELQGVSGGMAAQSKTLGGQFSNLLDQLTQLGTQIGQILVPVFQLFITGASTLVGFVSTLVSNIPLLTTAFVGLGTALLLINFGGIVGAFTSFVGFIPALLTGIGSLTGGFTALSVASGLALGPIGLLISGFTALVTAYSTNLFGIQELINGFLGLGLSQDQIIAKSAEMTTKIGENTKKLDELTKAGGSTAEMMALVTENQNLLTQAVKDGTITDEDARSQYEKNIAKLEELKTQLDNGSISQEAFNIQTNGIIESQSILGGVLGAVETATIANTNANDAYNNAKLDTTVSQQQLEALRLEAIAAANSLRQALILQLESQKSIQKLSQGTDFGGFKGFDVGAAGIEKTQKRIDALDASLKDLNSQDTKAIVLSRKITPPPSTGGSSKKSSGGGGGKSPEQKAREDAIKTEQKALDDLQKKKEQLAEKEKALLLDLANANKANAKAIYDSTVSEIDKVQSKIAQLDEKIAGINKSLAELGASEDTSLATRVVEINKALADQNIEQAQRIALEKELALATANTTAEEIAKQTAISQESATERILRENAEKKAQLELQLADAQTAKDAELAQLATLTAQKLTLEQAYTAQYNAEVQKRETAEVSSINRIKDALADLRSQQSSVGLQPTSTTNTSTSTNNNQKTISNTFVVNSSVDLNQAVKKVSGF